MTEIIKELLNEESYLEKIQQANIEIYGTYDIPEIRKTRHKTHSFIIDGVSFPLTDAVAILKRMDKWSLQTLMLSYLDFDFYCRKEFYDLWISTEPISPENALKFSNTEQRRVAITAFDFSVFLEGFNYEIIDKQTITKTNRRWFANESGDLEEKEVVYDDVYELISLDANQIFPNPHRFRETTVELRGVRCSCTTTGRQYFLFVKPDVESSWNSDAIYNTNDAIEAIAATLVVNVKPEYVKSFRRQGDVVLTILKPGANEKNWKCEERPMTKEEYLTKLESET